MNFIDDYSHETHNIMYISQSILTKEVEDLYEYNLIGCTCEAKCERSKCSCIERSGTFYVYNDVKDKRSYSICEKDMERPTYECNDSCKCTEMCGNRLAQFGPREFLRVQNCKKVDKGNFICEYAGEIITEAEALKRYKTNGEMNYIFCINERFGDTVSKTFIDPTFYGNIGRYINHSCDPNCKLYVIRINDTVPILAIFANEDINENNEITYDYGDAENNLEAADKDKRKICHCNSTKCRKFLPFDISLA
ncbi:hypothetical protein NQ317_004974 [Molorchus minor]|uniref:Histone-lysine N-methyltransferase set-23 n=1 Tax=Molorchus minor TaxID=1323400 RepID=A0ABQ9K526_9CUCU|nr:hypothetical protein NQ317_004974 [Molorchus minor]